MVGHCWRSRGAGGGSTGDYHPTVLMNRSNDTAVFNPSNNDLYRYPLVLSTLRYSVGMMHSDAGTLREIVGRTCTHRERFMRKNGI